ncbi:MAG: hypothetical protein JRM80_11715 [Nitrososphaerota archaeon]|nr:hypothetical protein [Nitrososphaerota archaeon]
MGSFFAGIKAGTLSGILYVGGMAIFNVALLYALKADVLSSITQSYPAACPAVPNINGTSVEDCFASVVAVDVPFRAFVAFFVALLYAGLFGMYHDSLPKVGTTKKGILVGAIVGVNLIIFGFAGYIFDGQSEFATLAFLAVWTGVFGYFLGRLYGKYTRLVGFESQDQAMLRLMVDGRDVTGSLRTFAVTSNHRLRAEVSDDASFREWEVVGEVTLEDPRSFETVMEVNGGGTLRGKVTPKY